MANTVSSAQTASAPLFTPELVDAQGRNDREYLSARVKLLLEAKDRHQAASFSDIAQLANVACGCGCCCCCNSLVLGADLVNPAR